MNPVNSHELLQELRKQIATIQDKAENRFGKSADAALQFAPAPGKWTAVQCLEHLNTYGRYYLPELEKAIAGAEKKNSRSEPTFKSSWLGAYFTRLMQPKDDGQLRSQMKSPKDHIPAMQLDVASVLQEFADQQQQLEALLIRAEKVNIRRHKVATSLSRFIKLSVGDTFGFLIAHINRHVLQAERAMAGYTQPVAKIV